jgi:hypothetical protein
MALAASASVTTEQESNVPDAAEAAAVDGAALGALVVGAALGALVVGAAPDVVEADEPQPANRTAAHPATDRPAAPRRCLMVPSNRMVPRIGS